MRRLLFVVAALGYTASLAVGQTSYPMITHITPVAVQRGTTIEVLVEGTQNFQGVNTFLTDGKGVSARVAAAEQAKIDPANPQKSVKLQVTVAADAPLGVREFRLATALGISTLGQLLITADPVVLEAGDNNTPAKAQPIAVPCVISGKVEVLEDVDCFRFKGKAGQTIVCEVYCARLEDKIHDLQKHADPLISLSDSAGRELAANDDANFADPLMTHTLKSDGEYILQIRDAKYDGDPRWVYALAVSDKPYVSQLFPLAVNPGQHVKAEPIGSVRLRFPVIEFDAPQLPGLQAIQLPVGPDLTNPTACIVTSLPLIVEQEPNDTPAQANPLPIPGGVNARVGTKRDLDFYSFKATKGRAIRFEVFSRRFGTELKSPLDSTIDVLNKAGTIVGGNDDANGKDSLFVFTPPADGDYTIRVRDLNSKGSDAHVYYLEADWARPDFTLKCDPSKVMLGPGGRAALFVQATRLNDFAGPIAVEVTGLPKGFTVNALTIPPTMTQGTLVLAAPMEATTPTGFNINLVGTAEIEFDGRKELIARPVVAVEEIISPGGGRGRFDVRMQSVALTGPSEIFTVKVSPARLTLKPGEEVTIDVEIERRNDFDKVVNIDVPLRHLNQVFANALPPGVTMVDSKSKTLLGVGNKGQITLKADATAAPIDDVPIAVLANVSISFVVRIGYASPVILLSVKK